jgi:TolA-binding protein
MKTRHAIGRLAALTLILTGSVALADGPADQAAAPETTAPAAARSLTDLGLRLEAAKLQAAGGEPAAVRSLADAMANFDRNGAGSDRQAAVLLLSGQVSRVAGDLEAARDAFSRAARKADGNAEKSLAEFLAIEAREEAGDDEGAADDWKDWLDDYRDNPLVAEARLHLVWNQLRRGELAAAAKGHRALGEDQPWLLDDTRFLMAGATASYLADEPKTALGRLASCGDGPGAVYLQALCYLASGEFLQAAARFQEVSDRFPHSPLRDYALLGKANTFLVGRSFLSAADEFARVVELATVPAVVAEAALRRAGSVFLSGDVAGAEPLLRQVVAAHAGTNVAARAQFLLGEAMVAAGNHEAAILEYNRVLSSYFDQSVVASAQYRLGRCFDALGRETDATSAYQAVVSGYPLEPEAPAAAYLAGTGLLKVGRARQAAPYFQLVLDRYASTENSDGTIVFASPEHQELVEASLCLLELTYHRLGELGQISGPLHLVLQKTPPSRSTWRAYAWLIDADALAAQGLYAEARDGLETLFREFPGHAVGTPASQLLAWTYAQQGEQDLAVRTAERMLAGQTGHSDPRQLSQAFLNVAHVRFNQGRFAEAATAYEEFLVRYPDHAARGMALYQAGLCYLRLDRAGDAVDRWEALVATEPEAEISEKAWARAGDVYFQAEDFERAKSCYRGLLDNFAGSGAAALGLLRIAQCDYNSGDDAEALAGFSELDQRFPDSPFRTESARGTEMALYRLGQQADGTRQLAELIDRYPTSSFAAEAQFRIAQQLYEAGDYARAAEEFRRVVSRFPAYSAADRAQYLVGDAYEQGGAADAARQAFEQFLVFFGDSPLRTTVRFRLGMIHFAAEDYMRAATNFTDVLARDAEPEMAAASLYNRALCQRMLGDLNAASADLAAYQERYPADARAAEVAYQLGDIHDGRDEYAAAVTAFKAAAAAGPSAALAVEIAYRLGASLEKSGDLVAALAAYRQASACKDKSDSFRLSAVARAAGIHERNEDYRQALAAYRDLMDNARDPDLVAAATGRASELASVLQ